MINALQGLIQNPQNNLKIFKNGQLYYGESSESEPFENFVAEFFKNKTESFDK
jgi:hypothetical protein